MSTPGLAFFFSLHIYKFVEIRGMGRDALNLGGSKCWRRSRPFNNFKKTDVFHRPVRFSSDWNQQFANTPLLEVRPLLGIGNLYQQNEQEIDMILRHDNFPFFLLSRHVSTGISQVTYSAGVEINSGFWVPVFYWELSLRQIKQGFLHFFDKCNDFRSFRSKVCQMLSVIIMKTHFLQGFIGRHPKIWILVPAPPLASWLGPGALLAPLLSPPVQYRWLWAGAGQPRQ